MKRGWQRFKCWWGLHPAWEHINVYWRDPVLGECTILQCTACGEVRVIKLVQP